MDDLTVELELASEGPGWPRPGAGSVDRASPALVDKEESTRKDDLTESN